jgi:hypothetical protein
MSHEKRLALAMSFRQKGTPTFQFDPVNSNAAGQAQINSGVRPQKLV